MSGRVWKFGDDVDTDAVIPGRYLIMNTPEELAAHAFEGVRPEFPKEVKEGDIIVAGNNFGCGSSREHAPIALKGTKINCVIAKSFARIFFRNSINIGVALLECPDTDKIEDGDQLDVDFASGAIKNVTKGEQYQATPLPEFVRGIMDAGGLIEYTRQII
ncbi:MAG: 3-isopropylmalate/(R)-2-methylmalate dehydratase small subunit [Methanolobus sp.]|jgi:3-isopropylmalate/(R)-2-methylmalate dehydratase small subunit|uniref:3-isopropylmalate dehydratase small subunit n=1 Tax=Methanolobus sp. TaxID=1874737 RepID=UPI0024AB9ED8|nr:3-isopropylmalate dehydratase small subunit [Methanolobus sp.]MDI3486924.1 3-isopropylmalate/(R)-2-methylmalate dehydratase small subunit [Methanolobus sp.]MDK2832060.1 3-isopropylmalate/(R)-2-methylmalate dehydratase small subunit [Methanolobus sp.]MDK2938004.1 3-isopropylmalate/(R)-2-methylmalate dehydratase small subunit [Methanolobus sp.]